MKRPGMLHSLKTHGAALCLALLIAMTGTHVNANSDRPSDAFIKGFEHELSNRAFSLQVSELLSQRHAGRAHQPFWQAYLKLEQFNLPRFQAAALNWGLDSTPGGWTRFRARAVASMPSAFYRPGLKLTYPRTVAYVEKLRELRRIGPADAQSFLDYMVVQEELQVEMMQLALSGNYPEITRRVDAFILKYDDALPASGQ